MHSSSVRVVVLVAATALTFPSSVADEAYFRPLGFMPGGGDSVAIKISGDGRVVVGVASSNQGGFVAFRWTADAGYESLGDFDTEDGVISWATGVSSDGSVVAGTARKGTADHAFRWTRETGLVDLGELPGGADYSWTEGVSGDGNVVVGSSSSKRSGPDFFEAFRWTEIDGLQTLGDWPREGDEILDWAPVANDASYDGDLIVGGVEWNAYLWTADHGFERLGFMPGGIDAYAYAISGDGAVIVGNGSLEVDGKLRTGAFRWTREGGMQFLGDIPNGDSGIAYDTSYDGSIVVGIGAARGRTVPLIWEAEHGPRDLEALLRDEYGVDLKGFRRIYMAWGVSDDGRTICGYGFNADSETEAWVAHIPACNRFKYPLGDSNGSGTVDFDDIACFVAALIGKDAWKSCGTAAPSDHFVCVNDANQDGAVDFADIDSFVECLANNSCP